MTWKRIREQYTNCWVIIEAIQAHTQQDQRVLDKIALVATFDDDWKPAWERYKALHSAAPEREFYMVHTAREQLDIGVLDAFGRGMA